MLRPLFVMRGLTQLPAPPETAQLGVNERLRSDTNSLRRYRLATWNASAAALIVRLMSSSVCAAERKSASNCDGAK